MFFKFLVNTNNVNAHYDSTILCKKNNCLGYKLCWIFWSLASKGLYIYTKYMLSTLKFPPISHLKSMIYTYHGSEKYTHRPCYHRSYAHLLNYVYGHCITLINTVVHNTIQTKPYRAAVIEHSAGNYYSSIMLNRYQTNSANSDYLMNTYYSNWTVILHNLWPPNLTYLFTQVHCPEYYSKSFAFIVNYLHLYML